VVSRAQWGADESLRKGTPLYAPVTKLIVHHTVTPNVDPDPAATIRAMYAFHTQIRGWDDIGYNFLVDAQGRVYEGRWARAYGAGELPTGEDTSRRGVVGAHAEGTNTGSAGIALLGDFTSAAPSAAALASLEPPTAPATACMPSCRPSASGWPRPRAGCRAATGSRGGTARSTPKGRRPCWATCEAPGWPSPSAAWPPPRPRRGTG
jgi:hypothetical protein